MKKIAITSVVLIAAVAAIFLKTESEPEVQHLQVKSQQDTEVDTSSSRDTFEYFLSGMGEAELTNLKDNFSEFNKQRPADQQIDMELFQKYLDYKNHLQTLEPLEEFSNNLNYLALMDEKLLEAQLKFFTPEQQKKLFGEENLLREITLKRMRLQESTESEAEFRQLWQQELQEYPPEFQISYNNASLISDLAKIDSFNEQDKYLQRQALVGDEVAIRLTELEKKQADFASQVDVYLSSREQIQLDNSLDDAGKELAIKELRELSFAADKQRRLKSLESIHDEQQKSN